MTAFARPGPDPLRGVRRPHAGTRIPVQEWIGEAS